MQDVYAKRQNTSDRAMVAIYVYVDADTLKEAEEIVQDSLNSDRRMTDYAIDFEVTAWKAAV